MGVVAAAVPSSLTRTKSSSSTKAGSSASSCCCSTSSGAASQRTDRPSRARRGRPSPPRPSWPATRHCPASSAQAGGIQKFVVVRARRRPLEAVQYLPIIGIHDGHVRAHVGRHQQEARSSQSRRVEGVSKIAGHGEKGHHDAQIGHHGGIVVVGSKSTICRTAWCSAGSSSSSSESSSSSSSVVGITRP